MEFEVGDRDGGMKVTKVYPVFIKKSMADYLVYVPDLEIYTEGKDLSDAISMARDAIGLKGIDYEDMQKELPAASDYAEALIKAKSEADGEFDFSDGLLTLVDVDFAEYRKSLDNRAIRKNCTIPYWLNAEAEKAGINFSRLLQEALIAKLNPLK